MEIYEELLEIRDEKLRLEEQIAKAQDPHLAKMVAIKEAMEKDIATDAATLAEFQEREKYIREQLLESWDTFLPDDKQFTDDATGITVTRKVRQSPYVHDTKGLMALAVTFDELPVKKVTWNNPSLKALIKAGVIKSELATLQEKFELAITFPKEE